MKTLMTISMMFACTLLAACGGGGGGGGDDVQILNLVVPGDGNLDGVLLSSQNAFTTTAPAAGDTVLNLVARGGFAFDLATVPAGIQIQDVTLRISQDRVLGSPYIKFGNLVVDHLRIGPSLSGDDYDGNALATNIGTLSTTTDIGYKSLDVTARVLADIAAARAHSAFRVRFIGANLSDNGSNEDIAVFGDADDTGGTGTPPQLVIRYRAP